MEADTPGTYFQKQIVQKQRAAIRRRNDAGLISMWPEAIHEVLKTFPDISPQQKAALRANVEEQVRLLCTRTRRRHEGFTPALQQVARLLGRHHG